MRDPELDQFRAKQADRLVAGELDVLVIGGGILGAGVARDAALRGLRVGLADQHDFAFGTSSRTSRLLHGGIRYLAQGRIGLVYEASREKRVLHAVAPHLAQPLAFVFPTYRRSGWPRWKLRLGVKLYDKLCGARNLGPSSWMTPDDVVRRLPQPRTDQLTGAVRYYDGLTNDARLVFDTLRSAARHGAAVLNYCRVESARQQDGLWRCETHDNEANRRFEITCRSVVHTTGPWAQVLPQSGVRLRLTKGVHLVVQRDRLPVPDAVVMTEGVRILFAIPWGDRVILGTTDTDYRGCLDQIRTESADVDYILKVVNQAFPSARLNRSDVVSTWAGLRPLIAHRRGRPSDTSRAHQILHTLPGWFDVAGGKLTTYRWIAEQVIQRVGRHLDQPLPPCRTADLPLLEQEMAGDGLSGILPPEVSAQAVAHFCRHEWAVHLDDIMVRRTGWRYYHRDDQPIAEQVVRWMGQVLGWGQPREDAELGRYKQLTA